MPILVHGDVTVFDSTQIFEYFEDVQPTPPLWPEIPAARAEARLLELKSDEVFFPHIIRLMSHQDRLSEAPALAAIAAAYYYNEMELLLNGREYLNVDYSYADIAFFMAQLFAARLGAPMTEQTPASAGMARADGPPRLCGQWSNSSSKRSCARVGQCLPLC